MKMYNRVLAAALCLCLVLGCLGMAACAEGAGTANPGTYTASAVGKNGDVTLTVTYSENAITDVQVEEAETPTIGGAAVEAMTAQVLAEQTLTPDAEEAAEKMEKFLIWLKKRNAAPDILLIAPVPIGETGDEFYRRCHRECIRMNQLFREAAGRQQVRFADAGQWNIRLAFDQVHFSPEGCRTFAARLPELFPL